MKTFISTLLASMLVALFIYYLNLEKTDIRYTLSESIPISFLGEKSNENIQQLEVKNIGNSEAKNIQVIIKGQITNYQLIKYSQADSVKEFISKSALEILYPTLPPQGNFKIIMKSLGAGINKENLNVSHSKGKGTEALAKKSFSLSLAIFLGIVLIYITLITSDMRKSATGWWESKTEYSPDEVLKKEKPFYAKKEKWDSIRKKALEQKIYKDKLRWYGDIEKSASYMVLSIEKPDYLHEEEWKSLIRNASETLSDLFSLKIAREYFFSYELLELVKIPPPKYFPPKAWIDIKEKINKAYFAKLSQDLEYKREPMKFVEEQKLDFLKDEDIEKLKRRAYQLEIKNLPNVFNPVEAKKFLETEKPKWITDSDYNLMESRAKSALELDMLTKKYNILFGLLNSSINQMPLETKKPELLTDEEWKKLVRMDEKIRILREENYKKEKELLGEKEKVTSLKDKIERQLNIIHEVLDDPSIVDRVEEYSNVFAPGNFENLKKSAKKLNDKT